MSPYDGKGRSTKGVEGSRLNESIDITALRNAPPKTSEFYYEIGRIHARFDVLQAEIEALSELIVRGEVEE